LRDKGERRMGLSEIRKNWQPLAMVGDAVIMLCLRDIYFKNKLKPKGIHENTYFLASNESLGRWAKSRGIYNTYSNHLEGSNKSHASFFEAVRPEIEVYAKHYKKK
jgi:hypothetical protein